MVTNIAILDDDLLSEIQEEMHHALTFPDDEDGTSYGNKLLAKIHSDGGITLHSFTEDNGEIVLDEAVAATFQEA